METQKDAKGYDYFELDENDLDQEFDQHLKELSDRVIQKKSAPSNDTAKDVLSEFNMLKDFEADDEDVDDFKVTVRAPLTKTSL